MSLPLIKEQIYQFLQTRTPEVMAIRGAWGVGKTFAWNKYLIEAKNDKKIAMDNYAYVSLFGLNSMDELKLLIFVEMIHKHNIGTELGCLGELKSALCSLSRKAIALFRGLPYTKNFWPTIQALSFYSVKNSIICIDDFERKGRALDAQDIMGLIAFLKEQKQCKVILILNDESLENVALIDYTKYREKVIDIELVFDPTPSECAAIALQNDAISIKLKGFIETLGINNIRIIKKIERISKIIEPHLSKCEDEVIHQALQSLTLFVWCFYSNSEAVPAYDYVKNFNSFDGLLGTKIERPEKEKKWDAVLRRYSFTGFDEFDLQIATAVERGYIHENNFKMAAKKYNDQIVASKLTQSFSDAWRAFHDSFDNDEESVVPVLYESFKNNAKYISLNNLDGTVRLFRKLGKNELADEIINIYINEMRNGKKLFALSEYSFAGDLRDQTVIDKFTAAYETQKETRSLKDVVAEIAGKSEWGHDDEEILANASPDDFYALFKGEKGPHLSSYVDKCLQFGRIVNASESMKKVAENATIALQRIGKESVLNSLRIGKYNIKPESNEKESDA